MTALCGGGTSGAKPGVNAIVNLGASALLAILQRYGVNASWLQRALTFIDLGDITLSSFCATDPPAIPTWTLADGAAILALAVGTPDWDAAVAKLSDLMLHLAWYEFCECKTGTATAYPTAPAPPSGVALPSSGSQACLTESQLGLNVFDNDPVNTAFTTLMNLYGRNPTLFEVQVRSQVQSGVGFTNTLKIAHYQITDPNTGAFTFLGNGPNFTVGATANGTFSFAPLANANGWIVQKATSSGTGVNKNWLSLVCNTYCGGASPVGGVAVDPVTRAMLQSILDLVTIIQRQGVPFAYVSGPMHSGLSGTGTVNVSAVIGVLLNVSIPARAGDQVGTPDTRWEVGWINFGTADGYNNRVQIFTDSQVVFPSVAGLYTIVGYTLLPGVTMTLTELVREP